MANMKSKRGTPPDKPARRRAVVPCELCAQPGGELLWRDDRCRVVLVADADYAGYCRVIWHAHVKEMTDLAVAEQQHCMRVVLTVERVLRTVMKPHKINLASFGNMTPHLHWHVIPRDPRDAHFPQPVWGEKQRASLPGARRKRFPGLRERLAAELRNLL
jgi:diadenosine tetraphosphate (Ap4A) HIT family hydrolase